jgi:FtsH-binding integral membrane protein
MYTPMDRTQSDHVSKVVRLTVCQTLFTFGLISVTKYTGILDNFSDEFLGFAIIASFLGILITLCVIHMSESKTELQLAVFTILETIPLCVITHLHSADAVLYAMIGTLGLSVGLITHACLTSRDYTKCTAWLGSGLLVLLICGILNLWIGSNLVHFIELFAGTLLFMIYIIHDVQIYVINNTENGLNVRQDFHIDAALNIYLDVINIFIRILEIVDMLSGKKKKKKLN